MFRLNNLKPSLSLAAALVASISFTAPVQAGPAEDAREYVKMWEPNAVTFDSGTLTVVTRESEVNETVYLAIIRTGLCLAPLFGKPLDEVTEIEILNRDSDQGYVYEDGMKRCEEFNSRPATDEMTKFDILGATHWF